MLLTVAALKSGGKTTTAIHLASLLSESGETLLIDFDEANQSSIDWAIGGSLPFDVVTPTQAERLDQDYTHTVIDTGAGLSVDELLTLARGSDLLIVPSFPDVMGLRVLMRVAEAVNSLNSPVRVLLTNCPPRPSHDAEDAKEAIEGLGLQVFQSTIRRSVWLARAALDGVTVDHVSGGGALARAVYRDYRNVLEEVDSIVKES